MSDILWKMALKKIITILLLPRAFVGNCGDHFCTLNVHLNTVPRKTIARWRSVNMALRMRLVDVEEGAGSRR